jgi:5-formyltetrahydrofolate cyclo-ligase
MATHLHCQATRGLATSTVNVAPLHLPQMSQTDIATAKTRMRAHAVAVRRAAEMCSGAAAERLAMLAGQVGLAGQVVSGYWPMGDEIDPRPLMAALVARGCRMALPVVAVRGQRLEFRAWAPGDDLAPGPHGTVHPLASAETLVPRVVLLPLLAFDRYGFRLGYGGGYYDRTLEHLRAGPGVQAIGVAYAAQEVDAVPHDGYDQRLDAVATESGLVAMTREFP